MTFDHIRHRLIPGAQLRGFFFVFGRALAGGVLVLVQFCALAGGILSVVFDRAPGPTGALQGKTR